MFRKPAKKRPQVQARQREDESLFDDDDVEIVKGLKRRKRTNLLQQSTMKDVKTADVTESTSSDSGEEIGGVVVENSFAASGSSAPLGPSDQGATATLDIDTEHEADAQAQFERVQQQIKEGLVKDGKILYKGQAMYGAKEAKDTVKGNASSGMNRIGPIRAPQFLRQTVRWDYAPDICKDYKETGFCTFGDSCKFLHDRSDYKHGWEIERDYASGRLNKVDETNYEINEGEDEFPEECYICGKSFISPVVTRCKHYFCETCALNSFRKSKRCQICGENTGGVFNVAKDLIAKLAGTTKTRKVTDSYCETSDIEEASCSKDVKEEVVALDDNNAQEIKQEFCEQDEDHDEWTEIKMENIEDEIGGVGDSESEEHSNSQEDTDS
uniref:RING finger protein 113A n=1 Tax=Angiostrongylus cantonensis TaxID=6313 RepID=A0A0K0DI11_ANGCA